MNCSTVVPFHGVQSFRNRLLQCGSLRGSQVLPANLLQCGLFSPCVHRPCWEPAQVQNSHGVTASFGCIHLLCRGVFPGLQVKICSITDLHGLQGHSLPHHGLQHGLQGNLCSGAWSTSSPSFIDLAVCRVVSLISSVFSLLSPDAVAVAQKLFPLLKYVIPWALPPSLIGLALASDRSILELAGIGSVRHEGSF